MINNKVCITVDFLFSQQELKIVELSQLMQTFFNKNRYNVKQISSNNPAFTFVELVSQDATEQIAAPMAVVTKDEARNLAQRLKVQDVYSDAKKNLQAAKANSRSIDEINEEYRESFGLKGPRKDSPKYMKLIKEFFRGGAN